METETKKIIVSGNATIKAVPDMVTFFVSIKGESQSYEKASDECQKKLDLIKKSLINLGFENEEIKTTYFNINSIFDNSKNKLKKVIGFRYNHDLKLDFKNETALLSKVYESIVNLDEDISVDIYFYLKDEKEAKKEALKLALDDAKQKALFIAQNVEQKLGKVILVDETDSDMMMHSYKTFGRKASYDDDDDDFKLNAEDVEVEARVRVYYEME